MCKISIYWTIVLFLFLYSNREYWNLNPSEWLNFPKFCWKAKYYSSSELFLTRSYCVMPYIGSVEVILMLLHYYNSLSLVWSGGLPSTTEWIKQTCSVVWILTNPIIVNIYIGTFLQKHFEDGQMDNSNSMIVSWLKILRSAEWYNRDRSGLLHCPSHISAFPLTDCC